jgi:hypothetical protein
VVYNGVNRTNGCVMILNKTKSPLDRFRVVKNLTAPAVKSDPSSAFYIVTGTNRGNGWNS